MEGKTISMLKFIVEKMSWANKLSKGDALDKSVEDAVFNCPVGKAVLIEPHKGNRYLVRYGVVEKAKVIVTPKVVPEIKEEPPVKQTVFKKKGKKDGRKITKNRRV